MTTSAEWAPCRGPGTSPAVACEPAGAVRPGGRGPPAARRGERRRHRLILFLEPPTRFFASWTAPSPDKRPAVLVAVLVVVFGGVLFTPVLSDYFGLTGPARPVFDTVLPALVLWFVALSAAYRYRVLDRVLGLDDLPAGGPPPGR